MEIFPIPPPRLGFKMIHHRSLDFVFVSQARHISFEAQAA